jgi:hypothetical protein
MKNKGEGRWDGGRIRCDVSVVIEFGLDCTRFVGYSCSQGEGTNDTQRSQCLASKTICFDGEDIFDGRDFTGCIAGTEILSIFHRNTGSVISTLS